jgi:hypothetical protein
MRDLLSEFLLLQSIAYKFRAEQRAWRQYTVCGVLCLATLVALPFVWPPSGWVVSAVVGLGVVTQWRRRRWQSALRRYKAAVDACTAAPTPNPRPATAGRAREGRP